MQQQEKYDRWGADSARRRDALGGALNRHGGDDVLVRYGEVALAFPSRHPHESTFDFPIIEFGALNAWAAENGWDAAAAPDKLAPGTPAGLPPIRFRKVAVHR